jgi:hypothetical protein
MRHGRLTLWTLAGLLAVALAPRPAAADAMRLTGNVETDFPLTSGSGVVAIVDNPDASGSSSPADVAQDASLPGITGWNIQDLRMAYDTPSDTMSVGLNFFGIAGDADADGNPGSATNGVDLPDLAGLESIVVAIDTNLDGTPDVIAGVPASKPSASMGTNAFQIASYKPSNMGLAFSFGPSLTDHAGALAFSPSADHPDFEFTIGNFVKLPGLDPKQGFIVSAFAGTSSDIVAGEDYLFKTRVGFPSPQEPSIPEPAALIDWAAVAGAALAWRVRRRASR